MKRKAINKKHLNVIFNAILKKEWSYHGVFDGFTWYGIGRVVFAVEPEQEIFNPEVMKNINLREVLPELSETEEAKRTSKVRCICQKYNKRLTITEWEFGDGEYVYIDEELVKLFPENVFTYWAVSDTKPVLCKNKDTGKIMAVIMPYRTEKLGK